MRRKEDPAGYAFDVLVDLAQQGNELAREIVKSHPDLGDGKWSCVLCWKTFQPISRGGGLFVLPICLECQPAFLASLSEPVPVAERAAPVVVAHTETVVGPDPVVADHAALEERVLADATQSPVVGLRRRGRPRKIAPVASPAARVDVPGPEKQELPKVVQPGAVGSPEWRAKMARFMPKGSWE